MAHITMFNHVEDTEMAVDAGKVVQDGEDIDIDLEFTDDGHQDEMMTEDNIEPAYDMMLGDAIAVTEQDEVMTDEGPQDQMFDEEITDAPVDIIEVEEPEFIPDVELEDETKSIAHEPLHELGQQESLVAENTGVDPQVIGFQPGSEIIPATVNTELEDHTAVHNSGYNTTTSTKEEVEELITWESDEEEDEKDEKDDPEQVKVGDNTEVLQPGELPIVKSDEAQASKTLEHIPAAAEQSTDNTIIRDHDANANEKGEQNDADEQAIHNSGREAGTDNENSLAAVAHTVHQPDSESDQREAHANETAIKKQALDQLHPIVIRYMEEEMSLFPPTIEEEHNFFFLSEKKLAFESCANLFKAFREVLHENISDDEALVLVCPDLGLDIHESIPETSTLSVAQLLHLHLGLSHNDGHGPPSPMRLELKHRYDVSGRLNQLYALLNSGKGYSTLPNYSTSGQTHDEEHATDVEGFGDEENDDDQQSAGEVQATGLPSNDDYKIQNGLATPPRESNVKPENEELDFQSPAAVQKNHTPLKLDKVDETGTTAYATASEEDDGTAQRAELASAPDVIDYDDEDDALEETLTNAEQDVGNSSVLPKVDLSQQTTNPETCKSTWSSLNCTANNCPDLAPSVTKDTDHSNTNDGFAHTIDNESFHEETFDLEDPAVESDTFKAQPANGKEVTKDSAPTVSGKGHPSINQETPTPQEISTTVKEFEEIDYSDDDDEPLPESSKQSFKVSQSSIRQSPKRSFQDLDEPGSKFQLRSSKIYADDDAGDTKRIRSSLDSAPNFE